MIRIVIFACGIKMCTVVDVVSKCAPLLVWYQNVRRCWCGIKMCAVVGVVSKCAPLLVRYQNVRRSCCNIKICAVVVVVAERHELGDPHLHYSKEFDHE
jgi:hypothetical protein